MAGDRLAIGALCLLGEPLDEAGAIEDLALGFRVRFALLSGENGAQVVGMLDRQNQTDLAGMEPVFVRFGESGGAAVLALLATPERYTIDDREHHVVIVPTAPVPFGGGLFFVPVESVEPAGMSVDEAPVVLDLIEELKDMPDRTILLVEHKMDVIRTLADRIIVLHNGALAADGPPAEVMASDVVQDAYMGKALEDV